MLAGISASSHAASPDTALDGEWLCHTQTLQSAAPQRHFVSIANGLLQTDTIDTDMRLTPTGEQHYSGQWIDPTPSTAATVRQLQLTAPDALRYSDHATPHGPAQETGNCQRLPTTKPAAVSTRDWQFIKLFDAHPTQSAVGYDQIYAKQARYRDTQGTSLAWKHAFDDWCQISGLGGVRKKTVTTASNLTRAQSFACKKKPENRDIQALKTAVIAPGGALYMTDGHHSLSSLWEAPVRQGDDRHGIAGGQLTIPVRIQADYQHLNNASFWRTMRAKGYTWLQQPDGSAITPAELPQQLGLSQGLQDDPYRALVYFTRKVGHQVPENAPEFTEFYWAQWLRAAPRNFDLQNYQLHEIGQGNGHDHGYLQAVHDAALLMTQAPAGDVVGPTGQNAVQMGKLPALNMQELQQLARKGTAPGKLAAALRYRHQRPH